jgi:hypothetical protein
VEVDLEQLEQQIFLAGMVAVHSAVAAAVALVLLGMVASVALALQEQEELQEHLMAVLEEQAGIRESVDQLLAAAAAVVMLLFRLLAAVEMAKSK